MSWDDSRNGNDGNDPWKGGQQANDLDKIVKEWQRKLRGMLGGRGGGGGGGSRGGGSPGAFVIGILLLAAWLLSGLYRVDEAERGVVQRFGAYTQTTLPGLHWHMPFPIERVDIVNTGVVANYAFNTEILTADRQYVFVQMVVQYRRADAVKYSFEVVDPESTLKDVTESALREVIGTSNLEVLVTERRDQIAPRTREILQTTLNTYNAGIDVTSLNLEDLDYPQAVRGAVDDTQMARNDAERYKLAAETYAGDILPTARGRAARVHEDAEAYRSRVVTEAEGDAARFLALLTEYRQAPRVTRERLYLDAIQEVYGNSNKVLLDADGSGNLLYLPIDKLVDAGSRRDSLGSPSSDMPDSRQSSSDSSSTSSPREADDRLSYRDRRTRQ